MIRPSRGNPFLLQSMVIINREDGVLTLGSKLDRETVQASSLHQEQLWHVPSGKFFASRTVLACSLHQVYSSGCEHLLWLSFLPNLRIVQSLMNMCPEHVSWTCPEHVSRKRVLTKCPDHVSWTRVLNTCPPEHVSWTRVLNMCPEHVCWTRVLNTCPWCRTCPWLWRWRMWLLPRALR